MVLKGKAGTTEQTLTTAFARDPAVALLLNRIDTKLDRMVELLEWQTQDRHRRNLLEEENR